MIRKLLQLGHNDRHCYRWVIVIFSYFLNMFLPDLVRWTLHVDCCMMMRKGESKGLEDEWYAWQCFLNPQIFSSTSSLPFQIVWVNKHLIAAKIDFQWNRYSTAFNSNDQGSVKFSRFSSFSRYQRSSKSWLASWIIYLLPFRQPLQAVICNKLVQSSWVSLSVFHKSHRHLNRISTGKIGCEWVSSHPNILMCISRLGFADGEYVWYIKDDTKRG